MLALDPELEFTGRVARVFVALEHGDDHDLDREWLYGNSALGGNRSGTGRA